MDNPLAGRLVREGDCLLWTGAKSSNGYGVVRWHGRMVYTHRLAYALHVGAWPERGLVVRHGCDTPACCAIWHLMLGTQADNNRDRQRRLRPTRRST